MCITKVCHLLPVFIWFSEVFAVLVYVALRSFVVSKQIILPCEPRYPNSKDTGGKTISSHRGMCFTSQQSASKLGVVCLNFIKTLSSVGNSLESLRSFCCHLFLASLSLPSQPYSEQGLAACWRLCRLCRTLLPCPKAVFWHWPRRARQAPSGDIAARKSSTSVILEQLIPQLSKHPPWHYQSQTELNPGSSSDSAIAGIWNQIRTLQLAAFALLCRNKPKPDAQTWEDWLRHGNSKQVSMACRRTEHLTLPPGKLSSYIWISFGRDQSSLHTAQRAGTSEAPPAAVSISHLASTAKVCCKPYNRQNCWSNVTYRL